MISLPFEKSDETGQYVFRDALILPDDHGLSDDELEALRQKRFEDWMYVINNPPIEE